MLNGSFYGYSVESQKHIDTFIKVCSVKNQQITINNISFIALATCLTFGK